MIPNQSPSKPTHSNHDCLIQGRYSTGRLLSLHYCLQNFFTLSFTDGQKDDEQINDIKLEGELQYIYYLVAISKEFWIRYWIISVGS